MSAEGPTSSTELPPPRRPKVIKTNQQQVLLYVVLTLLLSLATVWAGRTLLHNSETLIFAVGAPNSDEALFATKLANVLKTNASRFRVKIVNNPDNAKAIALFDHRQADLAVLRTDAKVPVRARALAILEHDLVLLLGPGNKKIKSLAELKKKKVAVLAENDASLAFVRNILDIPDGPDAARIQMAPQGSTLDKLFAPANGFGAVIAIVHASRAVRDKAYEQVAKRGGFTLNAIDDAKALVRKFPGISDETLTAGTLSASPEIPDDDLDTIGLEWLLVAQSRMSATTAGDIARIVYENKSALGLDNGFATHIEPASVEKDAFVMAHQGAADYINDDTKSFMDKYSDMMYLGAAALSVIGSIFATIYAKITRIAPEKASELSTAILDIGERIEHAHSLDQLECLQDELESILRGAVIGLRDGTISTDGLDTFRLGYEFVRDEIGMRRDYLKRHAGEVERVAALPPPQDDTNVVVVKTAQSA
ncbi:C4-dicarboxylate ABC transporter substrate-binding protein [Bradyrhizobium sp. INPA01-394B]|uniref:C4-dicarboxylate ABC transporter substrate-binding protein n=1 Tax=Bradyrhizobium campsiandrae TaxID=1729892 RepID=A0ABR7UC14_9BRAD|nr:TAXI family TRAP transporter solute-binding subunit [Bradyrhizobium campsiandrae]MBC9880664.1 C4-dicarboxylate ABC transporter substrate-binding protein [Bradyrhizobium campsiandrae]MBC9981111.1 C4-dicarboxylate ABC transporter substrate-binding protein [Bradyrhizobium campsiandrae]